MFWTINLIYDLRSLAMKGIRWNILIWIYFRINPEIFQLITHWLMVQN